MLDVIYKPLPIWPYPDTPAWNRRPASTFKADYAKTLRELAREISLVDGRNVEIALGVRPSDIRRDGQLRTENRRAPTPAHPGVELRFDSPLGRQVYPTDVCTRWTHNVRSILLGLEALRAVERYGIGGKGEQYRGFVAELESASSASIPTLQRGLALIEQAGSVVAALRASHPDNGGDPVDFASVNLVREGGRS